jgi:hypothetical protein
MAKHMAVFHNPQRQVQHAVMPHALFAEQALARFEAELHHDLSV